MFSFNHVTISAENLEKTLEFYRKFGFENHKEYHDENVDIVMLKLKDMVLEIFYYQEREELPEHSKNLGVDLKTTGNKHFGLGVKNIMEAKKFVEDNQLNDSEQDPLVSLREQSRNGLQSTLLPPCGQCFCIIQGSTL